MDETTTYSDPLQERARRRRMVGAALLAAGVLGLVASVAGILVGRAVVSSTGDTFEQSLGLSERAITAVSDTVALAEDTVGQVETGLVTLENAAVNAGRGFSDVGPVLDEVARIASRDVPDSIEAIRDAMPALIRVASVIDTSLRALSFLGVDYDADVPFDDALREIDSSLDGLPDRLRSQAALLSAANADIATIALDATAVGAAIGELADSLRESEALFAEYAVATAEAATLVSRARTDLVGQLSLLNWTVTLFGVAIALVQSVPIAAGLYLFRVPPGRELI